MAKLPRNRRIDNLFQPFVNLRSPARVNQFDVANFDFGTVCCLNALILRAFAFSLATNVLL